MDDGEGRSQLQRVLLKGGAVLVAICVVVAIGTFVMVKALGLDGGASGGATTAALEPQPVSPLPTTALPVPGQSQSSGSSSASSSGKGTKTGTHRHQKTSHGFRLTATPSSVRPMQRINLTGTYPGHDNMSIEVQSTQSGHWAPFAGVTAQVTLGTFQTYVMSGVHGPNKFRMFDPSSGKASNAVTVTVG